MFSTKNLLASFVLAVGLCSFQGCGASRDTTPTGTVTGKVTLGDQPVAAVVVEFYSSELGAGAMGVTQDDGTFKTEGTLPVGSYTATVTDRPPEPGQPAAKSKQVPQKYSSATTSKLEFTIKDGVNNIDIALQK